MSYGAPKRSQAELAQEARDLLDRCEEFQGRSGFLNLCESWARWDIQWRSQMPRDNPPWMHASRYNPPLTPSKVEDLHSALYGHVSGFDFFSLAAASKKGYAKQLLDQKAQDWTDLMRWSLSVETNSRSFLDGFVHDGVLFGHAVGFLPWLRLSRKLCTEHPVPKEAQGDKRRTDPSIIKAVLGTTLVSRPRKSSNHRFEIRFIDDDGEEKDGVAWVDWDHPYHADEVPVVMVEREVVYYDAPRPRLISLANFMVPPQARDLQTARRYWVRDFVDTGELVQMARAGIFNTVDPQRLKELKEQAARKPLPTMSASNAADIIETTRDQSLGQSLLESRSEENEILYEYAYEDIDGDGIEESVVRAVHVGRTPTLLMRHRVEYLFPHGRRPHFDWGLFPVRGRYYHMGVPELLEGAQIEENAYYQARSDILEIITKPGGMYDPMSGLAPDSFQFRPGMFIKARDPQTALREWNFPVDPTALLREQSGIELQAERVIGSTELGAGRSPTAPNSPRTLGGTAIVVRKQEQRSDVYKMRLLFGTGETSGGVAEFLYQYHGLYSALMPEEKEFRAIGSNTLRVASRAELQGRFDFLFNLGNDVNNPQLRMQNAALRLQAAEKNVLFQSNPMAFWEVTCQFFEAAGMSSVRQYLPSPMGGMERPPLSQQDEFYILSKGMKLDPLLSDDHRAHLAEIMDLIHDQVRLASMFTPDTLRLLNDHAQKHLNLLNQVSAMLPAGTGGSNEGIAPGLGRAPRVQAAMGGPVAMREPMAGPIESEVERGLVP